MDLMESIINDADAAPGRIKEMLNFRNDDELDIGTQKVQPLPILDAEIDKFVSAIDQSIPAAQAVNDTVPERVFQAVTSIKEEAKAGQITVFKASDLLELTQPAFSYARQAYLDQFQIPRGAQENLRKFDEVFVKMIENRMDANIDAAEENMLECRELLETAVSQAEEDRGRLTARKHKEELALSDDRLTDIYISRQDSIKEERGELSLIKGQCEQDIRTIDSELRSFHTKIDEAMKSQLEAEAYQKRELDDNRDRQRQLEQELRSLRQKEEELVEALKRGTEDRSGSTLALSIANEDVDEWRDKLVELHKKTLTALSVIGQMDDCTDLIMTNAQEKKREWKEKLADMDLATLLDYRDSLIAQGVLYNVISDECIQNSQATASELKKLETEKRKAARTGFSMKVKEIDETIRKYDDQKEKFQEDIDNMKELLGAVKDKLKSCDDEIKLLRPSLRMETLEERYKARRKAMQRAFDNSAVKLADFNSLGRYNNV